MSHIIQISLENVSEWI